MDEKSNFDGGPMNKYEITTFSMYRHPSQDETQIIEAHTAQDALCVAKFEIEKSFSRDYVSAIRCVENDAPMAKKVEKSEQKLEFTRPIVGIRASAPRYEKRVFVPNTGPNCSSDDPLGGWMMTADEARIMAHWLERSAEELDTILGSRKK
jgi:hypothetical protein